MVLKKLTEPVWEVLHAAVPLISYPAVLRAVQNVWCSRLGAHGLCPAQCPMCDDTLKRIIRLSARDHFIASFTFRLKCEVAYRIEHAREKKAVPRTTLTLQDTIAQLKARL